MYSPKSTHPLWFGAIVLTVAALSALADDSTGVSTIRFKTVRPPQPLRKAEELAAYDEVDPSGQAPRPPFSDPAGSSRRPGQRESSVAVTTSPTTAAAPTPAAPRRLPSTLPPPPLTESKAPTLQAITTSSTLRVEVDTPALASPPAVAPSVVENSPSSCQGCAPCVRPYPGCNSGPCTTPFGVCTRSVLGTQAIEGLVGQTILYRYDFNDGSFGLDGRRTAAEQLNPHGDRQLQKIAGWWGILPEPRLVIQPSGSPELDALRRASVVQRMTQIWGVAIPAEAVVTAYPEVPGTRGTEAIIQYENLLRQTEAGPQPHTDSGSSSGSGISIPNQSYSGQ